MKVLENNIKSQQLTTTQWWASRRSNYNKGLAIAGLCAFVAYAIISTILFADDNEFEITFFTTAAQGLGYLIMMGVANLFYNLGPFTDNLVNKNDDEKFRRELFNLGYWFSCALPFLIPVWLIVMYFQQR